MQHEDDTLEPDDSPLVSVLRWGGNAGVTVALLFGALAVFGWARAPQLPERAPDFALSDLDGARVQLSDFAGQTVVLNFWATWCGPCRLEAPTFDAFSRAHPDVPVLGITADGPAAKVRSVAGELGMTYPVLLADPQVLEAYEVQIFPTTVVVSPDGSVRWAHAGLMVRPQLAWATGRLW